MSFSSTSYHFISQISFHQPLQIKIPSPKIYNIFRTRAQTSFLMSDFQVDDWMELIDKDTEAITFKDKGGCFDDELAFLSPQTQSPKPVIKKSVTLDTDPSDDSILETLDCKQLKQDSDSQESRVVDYSKLLDEQNMLDLFSPNSHEIGCEREVAEDALGLAEHIVSEALSKVEINDFMQELLVLMEPNISSKQFEDLAKKLAYLKHELKAEKRMKAKQGKQKKQKDAKEQEMGSM